MTGEDCAKPLCVGLEADRRCVWRAGQTVKEWHAAGAPILLLGEKPVTRLDDLWLWLLEHRQDLEIDSPGMSAAAAKATIPECGQSALLAAVLTKGSRHGR